MRRRALTAGQLHDLQDCLCLNLRRTSRVVTQLYDGALRPFGLRATQLPILTSAVAGDGVPLASLAESLGMDRTTMLRSVRPLVRDRLVEIRRQTGSRRTALRATARGRALLARAYPAWRDVQARATAQLTDPAWRLELAALAESVRRTPGR